MKKIIFLLLTVSIILPTYSQAQNKTGWEFIQQNDHQKARQAFQQTLEKDSTDAEANKGMIFLSEVEGDTQGYYLHLNRLMRHHWDENYYDVFKRQISISYSDLKKKMYDKNGNQKMSSRFYVSPLLFEAYKEFTRREFEKSKASFAKIHNRLYWATINGFPNINGYGYTVEYPVEKEAFNPNGSYKIITDEKLSWEILPYFQYDGDIYLDQTEGVHYANTFFSVDKEQEIDFRITRSYPIKIWLDGKEIFASPKTISAHYDAERISMKLPAGNHRILIKYAVARYFKGGSGSSELDFDGMKSIDYNYEAEEEDDKNKKSTIERLEEEEDNYYPYYQRNLFIRLTDKNGIAIPLQAYKDPVTYSVATNFENSTTTSLETLEYFKNLVTKNDSENINSFFDYYMLIQSHLYYSRGEELEEFFAKKVEQNPNSVYFKYLAAKVYNENNKTEKSFDLMGTFDQQKTPIFTLLYKDLKEIDAENQSEEYEEKLDQLDQISRSNFDVIQRKLRFYDQKGRKDERIAYAKKMVKEYPLYSQSLQRYIDDKDNRPEDYYQNQQKDKKDDDKAKEKDYKKALKKYFDVGTYKKLIALYKKDKEVEKVLELYDEMIVVKPNESWLLYQKANYLYSKERYDEAMTTIKQAIPIDPNSGGIYEMIGDIHSDKGDKQTALTYYKKAQQLSTSQNSYELDNKIEKIEGEKQYKNKFETPSFDEYKANYEKVSKTEAFKKEYKDAESIILGYNRDVIWNDTARATYFYSNIMIKILTESGAKLWTQSNFDLLGRVTSAKVIRENGTETRPDVQGSFIIFKNLKVGDIIQVEGMASWSTVSELGNNLGISSYIPFPAPILSAKLEFLIPQNRNLFYESHKLDGKLKVSNREDGLASYRWDYENIPIPIAENAMVDDLEYYPVLRVSTTEDWGIIVDWYKAKTYQKLESNYIIDDILKDIIKDGMTDKQKIETIFNYISQNINYSSTSLLQSGYIPKDSDLTCSSKIGDCKDVATIMITMLRKIGIESYYVLVKVNENTQPFMPLEMEFNHAIVAYYLDGKINYSDPTTDFYPYYSLNEGDTEAWALLIKDGQNKAFRLPPNHTDSTKTFTQYDVTAALDEFNTLDLEVKTTYTGLVAGRWRSTMELESKDNLPNHIISSLGSSAFRNLELDEYDFDKVENISVPLEANYQFHAREFTDDVTGIYFMRLPFVKTVEADVAIYGSERTNAMDIKTFTFAQPHIQRITVKMNKNFAVKKLPQNVNYDTKFGTYTLKLKQTAEGLYIERFVHFKQTRIEPSEFKAFKEFYLQLLKYDNLKVLLQQK
ncbi:transglutaminase domain-containing protein [Bernardetia sp. MNP-M8]|uniref:transglutaminase domain-containing protein n=1 Tax=Bernardetia sp. MNP-M8 TaxID=3127470 RepID=UPI0030D5BF6A